jgi:hypothetical protein
MTAGAAAAVAMVGAMVLIPAQHLLLNLTPLASWLIDLAILVAFLVIVGGIAKGRIDGVLIDERNKVSLSRLQTALWSVVVIGSIIAFSLIRFKAGVPDPLNVPVPEELLIAIGVTTTALVGTPIIHSVKQQPEKRPNGDQATLTGRRLGLVGQPRMRGLIVVNEAPATASWIDMLRGEEAGDAAALDIGKIQMFWFTGLLVAAYAVMVGGQLPPDGATTAIVAEKLDGLPALSASFIALLAISNGTYLANKAAPHTAPEEPPPAGG